MYLNAETMELHTEKVIVQCLRREEKWVLLQCIWMNVEE